MAKIMFGEARGPLNDLLEKLAGENGDEVLAGLKRFNRRENPWPDERQATKSKSNKSEWGPVTPFESLRSLPTATLGRRKDGKEYVENSESCGYSVSEWASNVLVHPKTKFTCAATEEQWDLRVASNHDAGFMKEATSSEIFARMYSKELGWNIQKLPAEVGPALREVYTNQSCGEWLLISMEPLAVSDDYLGLFRVERGDDGSFWLGTDSGSPGIDWSPDVLWVVGRRKSD